jgi:hypothetical protein
MRSKVLRVLEHDHWAVAEGEKETRPFLLRFRTPVIGRDEGGEYVHLLEVVWGYADEGSGEMPSGDALDEMTTFENRLCEAWESHGVAFLAAVLTFDGARQWVFYTRNVAECGRRIDAMPNEQDPYPIELTTREDAAWTFLHDELLAQVDWQQDQRAWEAELEGSGPPMDKAARKRALKEIRAKDRAAAREAFPMSHADLLQLFDAVTEALDDEPCDHSLRFTRAWLADRPHDPEVVVAWLEENGGYCDCEIANVEQHVEEAMHDA